MRNSRIRLTTARTLLRITRRTILRTAPAAMRRTARKTTTNHKSGTAMKAVPFFCDAPRVENQLKLFRKLF
jgi:hypothetical protein